MKQVGMAVKFLLRMMFFVSSGYFDLRKLDGTKIHASANYKKLKLLEKPKTLLYERREGNSSPTIA
jgi:hypothetical protein